MPTLSISQVIERGFAAGVAERLAAEPFTFTDRISLMVKARQLGIDPMRASLLIGERQRRRLPPSTGRRAVAIVGTVAIVQSAILAAATWACVA